LNEQEFGIKFKLVPKHYKHKLKILKRVLISSLIPDRKLKINFFESDEGFLAPTKEKYKMKKKNAYMYAISMNFKLILLQKFTQWTQKMNDLEKKRVDFLFTSNLL
jgi:hypothetical protein